MIDGKQSDIHTEASYEEFRKLGLEYCIPHYNTRTSAYAPNVFKLFVREGGCRVTDIKGKTYIDAFASLMYKNVGYGRREIADAVYAQLLELSSSIGSSPTIPQIRLAKKIADITPGDLSVSFFSCNGSDAVETGMKVARQYHRLRGYHGKYKIIGRKREYHGTNFGSMSLARPIKSSDPLKNEDFAVYGPLVPGILHVAPPHCYRCDFGLAYPSCDVRCAREVERVILQEEPESVAAFVASPVSAASVCDVPPPEYWPLIRSICDKYDVLLQTDCVVCGFGRTGKMFAVEHWNVVPDIMSLAKGLTSGYMPLGATVIRKRIADKFEPGPQEIIQHVYTFGGHPASCAAALANIEIIEREKLVENSAIVGKYLLDALLTLRTHRTVGDIRGIGLFCAVEFVKNQKTKEPFETVATVRLRRKLEEAGLLTRTRDSSTSLLPPLTFTKGDADETVTILDKTITEWERELSI